MNRIVLAYSGSVVGTVCIHWLRHKRDMEVATFSANLGQGEYLEPKGELAVETGADSAHVGDLRRRFVNEFVLPTLKANAEPAAGRPLSSALARPIIAIEIVKIAVEDSRAFVGHAGKPMSADQTQFEGCVATLAPQLSIISPQREWNLESPAAILAYAKKYGLRVNQDELHPYGIDRNLWGVRVQCSETEDLWKPPPESLFSITRPAHDAPNEPAEVVIGFDAGTPVSLDGKPTDLLDMIEALNTLGGEHGVGRYDVTEDRMTGIRSRRLYEAPAATILQTAHMALEGIVLTRGLVRCKRELAKEFATLIYRGHWFCDERRALSAFVDETQRRVTGDVRVRLYKGACSVAGRRSPYSMYDVERTSPQEDLADGPAMGGYAKILSLPLKTEARRDQLQGELIKEESED